MTNKQQTINGIVDVRLEEVKKRRIMAETEAEIAAEEKKHAAMDRLGGDPLSYNINEYRSMLDQEQNEVAVYAGFENGARLSDEALDYQLREPADDGWRK